MRTLVLSFILICRSSTILAQTPPAPKPDAALPFALKPLGHGIYAAIDNAKGESGANAGFVVGDDGIAVIDTFENEPAAKALLGEIRMVSKLPIKFVINTHYHLDHVAGNAVFAKEGAVIVAHRNVPGWIHTDLTASASAERYNFIKARIPHGRWGTHRASRHGTGRTARRYCAAAMAGIPGRGYRRRATPPAHSIATWG